MSLFDFHYISSEAEHTRLTEQQKAIAEVLRELSISSRIDQEQEHEKLLSTLSRQQKCASPKALSTLDINQLNTRYILNSISDDVGIPYDPIFRYAHEQWSLTSETPHSLRERTPSMLSSSSCTTYGSLISSTHEEKCPVPNFNLSERDEYGFRRSLWIKTAKIVEFEQKYNKSKDKQSKRWNKLFLNNDQQWPDQCLQLNRYVQKGVPQNIRAKAWMYYSGAQEKMNSHPGLYQSLLETNTDNNEYIHLINKEKFRLFPDNIYFYDESYEHTKLHSLSRVLTAFTYFSSETGYCKSIGLLAAFLLLVFSNEEEAFWMLVTTIHTYLPEGMLDPVEEGAKIEQTVFMSMVYEKMPSIWSKIANKKCFWEYEEKESSPSISFLMNHWFSTLFVNAFPIESVLRIWDCLLIGGGFKVMHQVALTLLRLNEKRISKVEDSIEVVQFLQSMPKQIIDCDDFMNCIFSSNNNDIYDISTSVIDSKRSLFKNRKIQRVLNHDHF